MEPQPLESLEPSPASLRRTRARLSLMDELILALLPTATVLGVFAFVESVTQQRLLFASLASSAFLIYLDPEHGTNRLRTLALSQTAAASLGFLLFQILGPTYLSGALAMTATIVLMIVTDAVHPPAVATALAFAFRSGDESNLAWFTLAVVMVASLLLLEKLTLTVFGRLQKKRRTGNQ